MVLHTDFSPRKRLSPLESPPRFTFLQVSTSRPLPPPHSVLSCWPDPGPHPHLLHTLPTLSGCVASADSRQTHSLSVLHLLPLNRDPSCPIFFRLTMRIQQGHECKRLSRVSDPARALATERPFITMRMGLRVCWGSSNTGVRFDLGLWPGSGSCLPGQVPISPTLSLSYMGVMLTVQAKWPSPAVIRTVPVCTCRPATLTASAQKGHLLSPRGPWVLESEGPPHAACPCHCCCSCSCWGWAQKWPH